MVPRLISKSHVVGRDQNQVWNYQKAQSLALQKLESQSATLDFHHRRMPDLKGKSLREVKRLFENGEVALEFRGSGPRVKSATPAPGVELSKGQRVRVIF